MGKIFIMTNHSGEGGADTSFVTATAIDILTGKMSVNADGEPISGSMPNNGAVNQTLYAGNSYTIPEGYHNGSGKITANSLASQTGVESSKTAVTAATMLTGYQGWVNGSRITGTMANNGAVSPGGLNCGGSYTIPAGYHNGSGKVTANSLSSQTSATATAAQILSGKTAWVNGSKLTGTLAITSAINFNAAAQSTSTIRISWTNPSKGPYSGVKIRMSTSGYPGVSGGTLKYTGTGSSTSAGGTSYVDITGLTVGTVYYFTCYSYATGLGDSGTGYNCSTTTKGLLLYNYGTNPYKYAPAVSNSLASMQSNCMRIVKGRSYNGNMTVPFVTPNKCGIAFPTGTSYTKISMTVKGYLGNCYICFCFGRGQLSSIQEKRVGVWMPHVNNSSVTTVTADISTSTMNNLINYYNTYGSPIAWIQTYYYTNEYDDGTYLQFESVEMLDLDIYSLYFY